MWITFDEIIEKHGWAPFQIVEAFKAGLHPYHIESGEALPYDYDWKTAPTLGMIRGQPWHLVLATWGGWRANDYILRFLRDKAVAWRTDEVDRCVKAQGQTIATAIPVPQGTQWHQVHFRIVSPARIEITTPDGMEPYHSDDLGFTQKMRELFEQFATEGVEYVKSEKMDISRLRGALRKVFPGVEGDPLPFTKSKGYKAAFHIIEA